MKQITTFFCVLAIGMLLCSTPAKAQREDIQGLSCTNPLPLTEDFAMDIPIAGSFWFTAWTYDLPLHARFYSTSSVDPEPSVDVYFSCTGNYDDPLLEEMLTTAEGWGVDVPIHFEFERNIIDGQVYYDLEISQSYRELMMQWGLTYDVKAYVNLNTKAFGHVELIPDTEFRNCVENADWTHCPDTLAVSQQTLDQVYIFPVTEWRNDSIRMRWTGQEQKVIVYMGSTCDFELSGADANVLDIITLDVEESCNNYRDFSSTALNEMIEKWGEGGLYYVRIVTTEAANLIIEPKPIEGALADAVMLYYDVPQHINAEDTFQYYFFRKTWERMPLLLDAVGAKDSVIAYIGTAPDFHISSADPHYIGKVSFEPIDRQHQQLTFSTLELQQYTDQGDLDFLFIRFWSTREAIITPKVWQVGDCAERSYELLPNDRKAQRKQQTGKVYRIDYDKWMRGDVKFLWDGIEDIYVYLADTCSFGLYATDPHVLFYRKWPQQQTLVFDTATMRTYADRVDADGFLYFRFNNPTAGDILTSQTYVAPEGPDEPIELLPSNTVDVPPSTEKQYYYFPVSWQNYSIDFAADETDTLRMYVGTQNGFDISGKDGGLIASYLLYPEKGGSHLRLSAYQIAQLATHAVEENLYAYFATDGTVSITPSIWDVEGCGADTEELLPLSTVTLAANTPAMFRIDYTKWMQQDVTFAWQGEEAVHIFLGDTCEFPTSGSNRHVLDYQSMTSGTTITYSAEMIKMAEYGKDKNGFLYVQLYSINDGMLTTSIAQLPDSDVPSSLAAAEDANTLVVQYKDGEPIFSVSTAQSLQLYNCLGTLIDTWYQVPGEIRTIIAPSGNIYILRGDTDAILIRK